MLRRTHRDALPPTSLYIEARNPLAAALGSNRTVAPGERRLEHHARHRRGGPTARPRGRVADDEVADRDAGGLAPGVAEGQCAGQVARHPVVAEGGDHPTARGLGPWSVLLEDAADERRLAGRVEVVGAGGDGGLGGGVAPAGERTDGRDEHIALLDERANRVRPRHVCDGDLEAARTIPAHPAAATQSPPRQVRTNSHTSVPTTTTVVSARSAGPTPRPNSAPTSVGIEYGPTITQAWL